MAAARFVLRPFFLGVPVVRQVVVLRCRMCVVWFSLTAGLVLA
jgi:hypothetical protein